MNNITITGRLSSTREVKINFGTLLNVYVVDDQNQRHVKFHSAFYNANDIEKIQSVNIGAEISYSGTVTGYSSNYHVIEVCPNQILSLANLKREYISAGSESEKPAVEDQVSLQHEGSD